MPRPAARRAVCAVLLALAARATPATAPDVPRPGPGRTPTWLGPGAPSRPRRVVSLAPSLSDLVVAMGLAERLVAVTRFDDAQELARLPRVGGYLDPSAEAVLRLRPDLVMWAGDDADATPVRRLAELGVPVVIFRLETVADVLDTARSLGAALGAPAAGEHVARELSEVVTRARARAAALPRRRALFVIGHDPLVVAGPGSYADELLRLAGGENVVRDALPWSVYPLEQAVADDPAIVIDGGVLEPPETLARHSVIGAVRRGAVRRLPDDAALRPGPRLVRALEELSRILHPRPEPAP